MLSKYQRERKNYVSSFRQTIPAETKYKSIQIRTAGYPRRVPIMNKRTPVTRVNPRLQTNGPLTWYYPKLENFE